jgi:two-component system, chemotaxis family, protein-glutamate methylesterase/glutaminase
MPGHDIIVVGASAGGVELALALAAKLPDDLAAAVFIVIHISPSAESVLPALLGRRTRLRVSHARDGARIEHGHIYVAPPDQHLILRRGRIELTMGPRENGHRPAVDSLFRSAAQCYGPRVVGVVLSGNLDDGTAGAIEIHKGGGVVIAQDPAEALYPSMPRSVIGVAGADHVAPLDTIANLLSDLSRTPVIEEDPTMSPRDPDPRPQGATAPTNAATNAPPNDPPLEPAAATDPQVGHGFGAADAMRDAIDTASGFTCPECHGALWEASNGQLLAYRCRVGHTYTQNVLLAEQGRALEAAMWTAYTALEEHAAFVQRMVARNQQQGNVVTVSRLAERARDLHERAALIRNVLARGPFSVATEEDRHATGAAFGVAASD